MSFGHPAKRRRGHAVLSSLWNMVADARGGVIRLRDGRALAYAEWGPADGRPVLHFHGVPDGRFGWGGGSVCTDRGVRLIAVDRPGVGGSDPKRGRSVADWPADVEELAEQLELDRFAVSGWSAGGAYALACAHAMQPRIDAVALVSGAGRLDLPGFVEQMSTAAAWRLAARAPSAMTLAYSALARLARRRPGTAQKALFSGASKVDRAVIDRPDVGPRLVSAYVEATRPGGRGLTEDMQAVLNPWGFEPAEVRLPVHLIHGRGDTVAPPAHAEHWIETLETARPVWIEDAGHFLIEDHVEEILDALAA
jgi:pimeloyl-ACP methyl ester carboxylesterase